MILYNLSLTDTEINIWSEPGKRGVKMVKTQYGRSRNGSLGSSWRSPLLFFSVNKDTLLLSWSVVAANINLMGTLTCLPKLGSNFFFYKMKEFATLASLLFPKHTKHSGLTVSSAWKLFSQRFAWLAPSIFSSAQMWSYQWGPTGH